MEWSAVLEKRVQVYTVYTVYIPATTNKSCVLLLQLFGQPLAVFIFIFLLYFTNFEIYLTPYITRFAQRVRPSCQKSCFCFFFFVPPAEDHPGRLPAREAGEERLEGTPPLHAGGRGGARLGKPKKSDPGLDAAD